jgi:hypothetical protein
MRFAITIAALGLSLVTSAEDAPRDGLDRTVAGLRSEPMSLFDWGLVRLEEELQSVRRQDQDFIRVYYDPAKNRIVVEGVFVVEPAEIEAIDAKRACFVRHHAIKLTLGVIDTDRIHVAPAADFRMGMKFSHHNSDAWPELPDAAKLGTTLLELVEIRVGIVSDPEQFPFIQDMRCAGALLSQHIDYGAPVAADIIPE